MGGILSVVAFSYRYSTGNLRDFSQLWFSNYGLLTMGPYLWVAGAAVFCRTKGGAIFTLAIAFAVFALGLRMYLSYARTGLNSINDIALVTLPMQRFLAYAALTIAIGSGLFDLLARKMKST